jgi:hypothetical protein
MNRYVIVIGLVALAFCSAAQAATWDMYVSGGAGTGYINKYSYDSSTHAATLDPAFSASGASLDGATQMAIGADDRLYVAVQNVNAIQWYNRQTGGAALGSVFADTAGGVALGPDTSGDGIPDLYATAGWGSGKIIRIAAGGVASDFATGLYHPEAIALGPDGNLYVASYGDNKVRQVTIGTAEVFSFADASGAHGVAFSADGSSLFVGQFTPAANVHQLDAVTGAELNGSWATGLTGGLTYVSNVRLGPDFNSDGKSDLYAVQNYGDNQGKIAVFDGSTGVYINDVLTGFSRPFDVIFAPSTVPEPGTFVLLAAGLIGLLAYAWRRRK